MNDATAKLLPRTQVTAALAGSLDVPLVLLTAPMGYGKTTAARHLMAALDFSCVYLSVPQGADSARWLWDYFCSRLIGETKKTTVKHGWFRH